MKGMIVDNEFEIGGTVYLKTDREQLPRMVTALQIRPGGVVYYYLSCGPMESLHYAFEITKERNLVEATA